MPLMQGHFGSVPEGAYSAPADSSTLLVQYATSLSTTLQPTIAQDTIKLLVEQGFLSTKRATDILACDPERRFYLVCGGCGNLASIRASGCNSRLCMYCNKRKRHKLFNRLSKVFATFERLRFLTIGWKNIGFEELTPEYFKKISKYFERLRQRLKRHGYEFGTYVCVPETKFHFAGEPKYDSGTGQQIGRYERDEWNVHYHVLFDGDYVPQKEISAALYSITNKETSYAYITGMTDGNPVLNQKKALSYTIKYLGKLEGHNGDLRVLAQFFKGTENVRFYNVGWKRADRQKKEKLKLTCTRCDSQKWISPFMETKYWDMLTAGKVPDEEGTCLKPPHPAPVLISHEDETMTIAFEDIEGIRVKRYNRASLLAFLNTPQALETLCGEYQMSEDEIMIELETLSERGDIVELPNHLWTRVQ